MKKRFLRFGITARIIWLTALFTIAITSAVLWQSVLSLSQQINQNNLQATEYRLKTAVMTIQRRVEEIDHLIDWCSVNASARTFLFSNINNTTLNNTIYANVSAQYSAISSSPYIQRFLICGSDGRIMMFGSSTGTSTIVTPDNMRLLPGAGIKEPDTKWEQISEDPLMGVGVHSYGIPISRKIYSGSKDALIYISVSPSLITDVLRSFQLEDGASLYWRMGDHDYRINSSELILLEDLPELARYESRSATLSKDTLLFEGEVEGRSSFVIVCPLGIHNLYLSAQIPKETLADQLPQMLPTLLPILLLVLPLGIFLALLLQRVVRRPVAALRRQIDQISDGNFSTDPSIEWNHELGDVGRGINHLSQSVTSLMESRLEDQKQRQDLEYRMLQGQISPHFLYNALNSIQWMATIQHATGIAEMTTSLSRLLKSVSKGNERLIPLNQELALLNDYFTIQRYRYGGTVTLDIRWEAEEIVYQNVLIPRFTLQPLAENAIFHGIEPKGCAGRLELAIVKNGEDILLRLSDDGIGMTEEQIYKVLNAPEELNSGSKFRHIGVQNVHRRLKYNFGENHGLEISSTPDCGTTVTIRIPIHPHIEEVSHEGDPC